MDQKQKGATHTVMTKKLAEALMDSGVQHFAGGGLLGGLGSILGTDNTFKANGPSVISQDLVPQADKARANESNVFGQQQDLANALLAQSQGQGPNPAQMMLNQQTGQNASMQAALMAQQRGAGANPALLARQAAMQGANIQQQGVGQAATLGAQQQLGAQNSLQQQQAAMQQASLQQEQIRQNAIAAQNSAAMGAQQINAGVSGQNAGMGAGLIGGLLGAAGAAGGFGSLFGKAAHGALIPDMNSGGHIPGEANVSGDSKKNDTVPILVSPGEAVIPRSIMNSDDPGGKAKAFVEHLLKNKKTKDYGDVAQAKKMAKGGRC